MAITAEAKALLSETVEVGARYNGTTWTPYIVHNEKEALAASLDIAGTVNAEIRIVPKIEVSFYTMLNSTITVEPIAMSQLNIGETTNNTDFLQAHPDRLINLTEFDADLGLEANIAVNLETFDDVWDVLESTCVLGTENCLYTFDRVHLFSIPRLELSQTGLSEDGVAIYLQAMDGIANKFDPTSVNWEVFPDDATITPGSCTKTDIVTTCRAFFNPGDEDDYTVFASGYGVLGEMARQYREITPIKDSCDIGGDPGPEIVVDNDLEWQRCPLLKTFTAPGAEEYCQKLVLNGHDDWRWPTKAELKSLVYCSNGKETPLLDWECMYPRVVTQDMATCCQGFNQNNGCITYDWEDPAIRAEFTSVNDYYSPFYTSEFFPANDCTGEDKWWTVSFANGGISMPNWLVNLDEPDTGYHVRCVREVTE